MSIHINYDNCVITCTNILGTKIAVLFSKMWDNKFNCYNKNWNTYLNLNYGLNISVRFKCGNSYPIQYYLHFKNTNDMNLFILHFV